MKIPCPYRIPVHILQIEALGKHMSMKGVDRSYFTNQLAVVRAQFRDKIQKVGDGTSDRKKASFFSAMLERSETP